MQIGDKVTLRDDVLQRYARSVGFVGYTAWQSQWRDILRKLKGMTGTVSRIFFDGKHANVNFGGQTIGIDTSELVVVTNHWN